jgi:hypothetical protein
MTAMDYQAALYAMVADPRYQQQLDWGEPRSGHPEGTVRAHIAELERNLRRLSRRLSETDVLKLRLLIHAHDTFKGEARRGAPIHHPRSHASLGRAFLAEFCDDADLLAMAQYHDEPFALWRQHVERGRCDADRMERLLAAIGDWNLFTAFLIIDGGAAGKSREPLTWFLGEVAGRVTTSFSAADLL